MINWRYVQSSLYVISRLSDKWVKRKLDISWQERMPIYDHSTFNLIDVVAHFEFGPRPTIDNLVWSMYGTHKDLCQVYDVENRSFTHITRLAQLVSMVNWKIYSHTGTC